MIMDSMKLSVPCCKR